MLTREEAERIAASAAKEAAELAVSDVLLKLGIDVSDAATIVEFQKDFSAMRDFVRTYRDVRSKGLVALVILMLSAAAGVFWVGVKAGFK